MLPAGYERTVVAGREVVAQSALLPHLANVLHAHATFYEWASAAPQVRALRGRAPVYVATLPVAQVPVVVRHAWHGGLLAPITGDRFRLPTRAPRELAAAVRLRTSGIGTTEVLGYALYPAGPGLRRVDVLSRWVPDAFDLGAVVSELAPDLALPQALDAVRALLVRLAHTGVVHPDLNVKNILLSRPPRSDVQAIVIDVDVVRFEPALDPEAVMQANVARLVRSLRKWRTRTGATIPDAAVREFAASCLAALAPAPAAVTPLATIVDRERA